MNEELVTIRSRKIYPTFAAYMKDLDGVDFRIEEINHNNIKKEMSPLLNLLRNRKGIDELSEAQEIS